MTEVALGEMSMEEALAHFGKKGMKWGVKTSDTSSASSKPHKTNKVVSGAKSVHNFNQKHKKAVFVGAAVVGTVAAAVIIKNRGSLPFSSIKAATTQKGLSAVNTFDKSLWNTKVSSMSKDISSSHAGQTKFMKDLFDSKGLTYNPRANPFSPEAMQLALPRGR